MKQSEPELRSQQVKAAIEAIMHKKGTLYTLGLLMGILCRMSRTDFTIVHELEQRRQMLDD